MNSAFPSRKMRDCELAHTFCFWKLFRIFTGKMTRGLSLRMVFSLLFQDTLFILLDKRFKMDRKPRSVSALWPNLPISLAGETFWSRKVLRRPSRVSHPWRCAHQQPLVTWFPPAKPPQPRRPISTSHLFGFARPRRQIWRRIVRGLRLHTPRTTAAAYGGCLLLHTVAGSLRLNQGKTGPLILAVRKVTSAPAHFWDRGARWFVVILYGLGQLVTSCSVFSEDSLA